MVDTPAVQYTRTEDGIDLAYWIWGDAGEVLLYLPNLDYGHTQLALETPLYKDWLRRFGHGFRLAYLDFRGNGLSGGSADFTVPTLHRDIDAVIRAVGVDEVVLYAEANLVPAAVEYAATNPDKVRALCLFGGYLRFQDLDDFSPAMETASLGERNYGLWLESVIPTMVDSRSGPLSGTSTFKL